MRVAERGRFAGDMAEPLFCVGQGLACVNCGSTVWIVDTGTGTKQWEYQIQPQNAPNRPAGVP